jgi:hypothetical protein
MFPSHKHVKLLFSKDDRIPSTGFPWRLIRISYKFGRIVFKFPTSRCEIRYSLRIWQIESVNCRSQWPHGLRRRSAAARLLRSWVQIPPGTWMFVCCEWCVLSGRGLCDKLIARPEESYWLWCIVVCDLETSRMRRSWLTLGHSTKKRERERESVNYSISHFTLWPGYWVYKSWIINALHYFLLGTSQWPISPCKYLPLPDHTLRNFKFSQWCCWRFKSSGV